MELKKVTAIIRIEAPEHTEHKLKEIGVRSISVAHAKGYGEYANFFRMDHCCSHACIEIIVEAMRAMEIAKTIMSAAHTGQPGDGIVDILPVEKLLRIRSQSEAAADEI